jgi:hypothetical protein
MSRREPGTADAAGGPKGRGKAMKNREACRERIPKSSVRRIGLIVYWRALELQFQHLQSEFGRLASESQ